jgi:hypothetical protein
LVDELTASYLVCNVANHFFVEVSFSVFQGGGPDYWGIIFEKKIKNFFAVSIQPMLGKRAV